MLLGVIFVIIFLSILVLVHEFGHFFFAKKFNLLVEEFGFGLPPKVWSKKIGETLYSFNALPFGGFVKILGEDSEDESAKTSQRSFSNLNIWKRAIVIVSGIAMNFLLGWLAISIVFSIGLPQSVVIAEVMNGTPAKEAGLTPGDKVNEFNKIEDFISYVNKNQGKEISLKIERNNEVLDFKITPRENPPKGQGALGVALIEAGLPRQNPIIAFWQGLKTSLDMAKIILLSLLGLIAQAFMGKASLNQIAGPVGIVKITSQASTLGFVYLIQLLGLISINLAVINIFPFPALDGGRLIFLLIEKVKGSPINPRVEKITNAAGLVLLLFLMAAITIKDIIMF